MPFTYSHVIVSGTNSGVEGVAQFIQLARPFLESAGWTMVDDRTAQAGSATLANTHKMVFSSRGESGAEPTFYMTIVSGTGAGPANNQASFVVHTAYDVGTHALPASGVASSTVANASAALQVRSTDSVTEVWMSGDADGVTFVTKRITAVPTFDSQTIAKVKSFYGSAVEPYGIFLLGSSTIALQTSTIALYGVANEPPLSIDNSTLLANAVSPTLPAAAQPYNTGVADSIYFAMPIVVVLGSANKQQGAVGVIPSLWEGTSTTGGMLNEGILTASGSGGVQTYKVFSDSTKSLIIRRT